MQRIGRKNQTLAPEPLRLLRERHCQLLPDVERAIAEAGYALIHLNADGIVLCQVTTLFTSVISHSSSSSTRCMA